MENESAGTQIHFVHPIFNPSVAHSIRRPPDVRIVPISRLGSADSPRLGGTDEEHVRRLAEMETTLPPILVHRATMRVIDGLHRLRAAILTGKREIHVEFFDGTEEEGFIQAVKANVGHGLPLTLAERRAAAIRILSTHPQLSDRAIAAYAGLAPMTVCRLRSCSTADDSHSNKRLGADGRVRPVSGQEGRQRAAEIIAARPGASLREVAAGSGVSVGTAHDVRKRMRRGESPTSTSSHARPERRGSAFSIDPAAAVDQGQSQAGTEARPEPGIEVRADSLPVSPRGAIGDTDAQSILHSLLKDPSLKRTDVGRALLQWLHTHVLHRGEWETMVAAVPAHRLQSLARLARKCGNMWFEFAYELECRDQHLDLTERSEVHMRAP